MGYKVIIRLQGIGYLFVSEVSEVLAEDAFVLYYLVVLIQDV